MPIYNKPLSLEFQDRPFELLNYYDGAFLVVIDRVMRTKTFPGMKQPIPKNALLGHEASLHVRHDGFPICVRWELWSSDILLQTGITELTGYSYGLNVGLNEGKTYTILISPPDIPL